ncbi:hypothetical protein FACS189444_6790 [Spirochaetia bacterium]|nr:hypothetical protein FACS189444_6790 [Spirochaetia bacterium]
MMRILRHGIKTKTNGEAGFVLLDAILSLFITALLITGICGAASRVQHFASGGFDRAAAIIEARNDFAEAIMERPNG